MEDNKGKPNLSIVGGAEGYNRLGDEGDKIEYVVNGTDISGYTREELMRFARVLGIAYQQKELNYDEYNAYKRVVDSIAVDMRNLYKQEIAMGEHAGVPTEQLVRRYLVRERKLTLKFCSGLLNWIMYRVLGMKTKLEDYTGA